MNSNKSYIWLTVAGVLLVFSNGQWSIPIAAWLSPIFLLRFLHLQKPLRGLLLGLIVVIAARAISFCGVMLIPSLVMFLTVIAFATIISFIPFIADRLVAPRLEGYAKTLVLPLTMTGIEYLRSFNPSSGSWGALAYTQWANLPLQLIPPDESLPEWTILPLVVTS